MKLCNCLSFFSINSTRGYAHKNFNEHDEEWTVWMHDQYNEQPLTSSMNIAPKKSFSTLLYIFHISHSRYQKTFFFLFLLHHAEDKNKQKASSDERVSKWERKKINEEKLITVNCRNLFCFFFFFLLFFLVFLCLTRSAANWKLCWMEMLPVKYVWMNE